MVLCVEYNNLKMASALARECNYKYMAEQYGKHDAPQVKSGKEFAACLDIKAGTKVLDMGCGTGELTSVIAELVGDQGEVIGVDPDKERIDVAINKHCKERKNISFVTGDSSSHFPHHNEAYYDIFYANFVFHWLTPDEKAIFLETALKCLKQGGVIAMNNQDEKPEIFGAIRQILPQSEIEGYTIPPFQAVSKAVIENLVQEAGFEILTTNYGTFDFLFTNIDHYLAWFCSSGYVDESKILPEKKAAFTNKFSRQDGKVPLIYPICRITAKKPNL